MRTCVYAHAHYLGLKSYLVLPKPPLSPIYRLIIPDCRPDFLSRQKPTCRRFPDTL